MIPNPRQAKLLHALVDATAAAGGPVTHAEVAAQLDDGQWHTTLHACRRRGWVDTVAGDDRCIRWFTTTSGLAALPKGGAQ